MVHPSPRKHIRGSWVSLPNFYIAGHCTPLIPLITSHNSWGEENDMIPDAAAKLDFESLHICHNKKNISAHAQIHLSKKCITSSNHFEPPWVTINLRCQPSPRGFTSELGSCCRILIARKNETWFHTGIMVVNSGIEWMIVVYSGI